MAPRQNDAHKKRALVVLLEAIDENVGEYDTVEKQNNLLNSLIAKHELRKSTAKDAHESTELTVEHYRKWSYSSASIGIHMQKGEYRGKTKRFFLEGSRAVERELLMSLGFRLRGDVQDSNDETRESASPPSARDSTVSAAAGHKEDSAFTQQPNDHGSTQAAAKDMDAAPSRKSPESLPSSSRDSRGSLTNLHGSSGRTIDKVEVDDSPPPKRHCPNSDVEIVAVSTPLAPSPLYTKLVQLSDEHVDGVLNAIRYGIQTFARNVQSAVSDVEPGRPAWVLEPEIELETLYRRTFGADWSHRARRLAQSNAIAARDLLEGCVGAAVCELLLSKVPWRMPQETLSLMSDGAAYADRVLQDSNQFLNFELVIWRAAQHQAWDKTFHNNTIYPHAERLADKFMITMKPHLDKMKATKITSDEFWQKRTDEVTEIFHAALMLNVKIKVAPDCYELVWAYSGDLVDRESMKEEQLTEGPQQVTLCIVPKVCKRATRQNDWALVSTARVFSRPKPRNV